METVAATPIVTLPFELNLQDADVISSMVSSLVHHVLYMRGMIRIPYRELKESLENCVAENGKLSTKQRKELKLVRGIDSILTVLPLLSLQGFFVLGVSVLLGPSVNNAKEIYSLVFKNPCTDTALQSSHVQLDTQVARNRLIARAKRTLIQTFIQHQVSSEDYSTAQLCSSLFLAVRVIPTTGKYINNNREANSTDTPTGTVASAGIPCSIDSSLGSVFAFRGTLKVRFVRGSAPTSLSAEHVRIEQSHQLQKQSLQQPPQQQPSIQQQPLQGKMSQKQIYRPAGEHAQREQLMDTNADRQQQESAGYVRCMAAPKRKARPQRRVHCNPSFAALLVQKEVSGPDVGIVTDVSARESLLSAPSGGGTNAPNSSIVGLGSSLESSDANGSSGVISSSAGRSGSSDYRGNSNGQYVGGWFVTKRGIRAAV